MSECLSKRPYLHTLPHFSSVLFFTTLESTLNTFILNTFIHVFQHKPFIWLNILRSKSVLSTLLKTKLCTYVMTLSSVTRIKITFSDWSENTIKQRTSFREQ